MVFKGCTGLTSVTFGGNAITTANFGSDAFPPAGGDVISDNLKTAYLATDGSGGAGTYKMDNNGNWTKQ